MRDVCVTYSTSNPISGNAYPFFLSCTKHQMAFLCVLIGGWREEGSKEEGVERQKWQGVEEEEGAKKGWVHLDEEERQWGGELDL